MEPRLSCRSRRDWFQHSAGLRYRHGVGAAFPQLGRDSELAVRSDQPLPQEAEQAAGQRSVVGPMAAQMGGFGRVQ